MARKGLLVVMVLLAVLMVSATIAQAQGNPPQGPTYVGSDKCAACHQLIHESWSATLHTKMILDPAKDPTVIKADFDKMSTVITDTKLQFKKTDGSFTDDTKETHQYPLGYTPGGDLSKANWQPFMPTGVVTDANWWVDGHAKQHRQQYLEWLPSAHAAALDAAPDGFKAAFTNVSFVKADDSKGLHNYPYAQAILAQADSDLKNIEQPLTPTPLPPTPVPPTPVPPRQPTAAPTGDAALRAAPGVNWLIWIGLAAIVVAVLVMLMTRKPKAS